MSKKLFFVFNPKAGKGLIKPALADIIDIFNKHDYEVTIYATQASGEACEMVKKYQSQMDLIVCSGGDGTLDEVVSGLMEVNSHVPVGYFPAGSTNDFANSMFMFKSYVEIAENIMEEVLYQCDVGRFNSRTFVYIAAFGLFTDVSYQTDQGIKNVLGHAAYVMEGAKRLFDIKSYHIRIESEELTVEDDFILGMVSNSRSVGGFKNLTGRDVDMDDGLFEATFVTMPKNPVELQEILTSLMTGDDRSERIYAFKTRHIHLISEETISWTLDGEFGGDHKEVDIGNCHKALNLYLKSR